MAQVAAKPLKDKAVKPRDFNVINLKFPRSGSSSGPIPTPGHSQRDFQFRDYAPSVFRRLREHFGIDSADYLVRLEFNVVITSFDACSSCALTWITLDIIDS